MVVFEKKIRKLRKNVDLKTKLLIIGEKIKNNKSLDDIAAQFGLERSTISKIVKSRDSTRTIKTLESLTSFIIVWIRTAYSNKLTSTIFSNNVL